MEATDGGKWGKERHRHGNVVNTGKVETKGGWNGGWKSGRVKGGVSGWEHVRSQKKFGGVWTMGFSLILGAFLRKFRLL